MSKKTARIYTRITEALDRQFQLACARRGKKRPDAVEEAIALWVKTRPTPPQNDGAIIAQPPLNEGDWQAKLRKVMRSQSQLARFALDVLDAAAKRLPEDTNDDDPISPGSAP